MALKAGFIKRVRDIMRRDEGVDGDAQRISQLVWMLFLKVYDAKEDDWALTDKNYVSIIPENCRWRNWANADEKGQSLTGDKLLNFINNTLFPTLKGLNVDQTTPIKKAIVKTTFEDAHNYMKDGTHLREVIDIINEVEFDDVKDSHDFGFVYEEILRSLQSAGTAGEFYTPRAVTEFMAQMVTPKLGERMADFACGTGGFITSWLGQLKDKVDTTEEQKQLESSIYGIEKKQLAYSLCITNMLLHDIEVPQVYHDNSLKHNLLDYTENDAFDVILMNPPYGGQENKSIQSYFPDDLASSETADLFMSVIMYRLKKNGRAAVVLPDTFLSGIDNTKVNIKKKLLTEFNLHTVIRLPRSVFSPYTSIPTIILFFDNTKPTVNTWFYRMDIPSDRKHFSKTNPMEIKHFDEVKEWWDNRKPLIIDENPKIQVYTPDYLINELGCNIDLCGYPHEEEEVLNPFETVQNFKERLNNTFVEINKATTAITDNLQNSDEVHSTISLVSACKHLSDIADNLPDSIRKSILQYAMMGKLTDQREEDGDARDLLPDLVIDSSIEVNEVPFDIPENWIWLPIGCLGASLGTDSFSDGPFGSNLKTVHYINDPEVRIIQLSNIGENGWKDKNVKYTSYKHLEDVIPRCEVHPGDFVIAKMMPAGRTIEVPDLGTRITLGSDAMKFVPNSVLDKKYLLYAMHSQAFLSQVYAEAHGITRVRTTLNGIKSYVLPIPPLNEQHRIVEKLDELLPYCD